MGQDGRRGGGVGQGVMGPVEGDLVAGAEVGQPMEQLAVRVETAGELQRAQPAIECERHTGPARGALDERGVEVGVVGGEDGAVETAPQLLEGVCAAWRTAQPPAAEAVHLAWADAAPRPRQPHEALPALADRAVRLDRHHADLQDAMPPRRQPRRLHVDHGEPGQPHDVHATQGVSRRDLAQSCRVRAAGRVRGAGQAHITYSAGRKHSTGQSSSAARLATSLRSQAVRVTWPKQGWPLNAWVSTARALFDSPR